MTDTPQPVHAPASLQRHIWWQLLGVVAMFSGIALSIWFSLRAGGQEQQNLLQIEAAHTQVSLVRLLAYYRAMLDKAARDPDLVDLMRVGTVEEQQAWAISRQRLLPDLLGVALVSPHGEVLLISTHDQILGGESGPKARPMHPDWVRKVRDACYAADVPFWFKQWGTWYPYCCAQALSSR